MAGLYIHIPFCHSKCVYCDFYSSPSREKYKEVVDGLLLEYTHRKKEIEKPFNTIYLGGGTPSILPDTLLTRLFSGLPVDTAEEITMEVNPEDVSIRNITFWKSLGINRISIGVQSLDAALLKWLGRRHSAQDAINAVRMLAENFNNISADLIYGIPGLSDGVFMHSLDQLIDLGISHLSAYCLTYHEGTPLYSMMQKGVAIPPDDEKISRQFEILREKTAEAGFEHYEISNFARHGMRSRHNSAYWMPESQWLGIGPSAHSFDGKTRRIDFSNTGRWLENLPEPFETDPETETDIINDNIVTALRTSDGLRLSSVPKHFLPELLKNTQPFIADGRLVQIDGTLVIPHAHWLVSDYIIRELLIVD